jgi:hypothetical protein
MGGVRTRKSIIVALVLAILGIFIAASLCTSVSANDPNDWWRTGNVAGANDVLGTTNNVDLVIVTGGPGGGGGVQRMVVKAGTGRVGIGTHVAGITVPYPASLLHVDSENPGLAGTTFVEISRIGISGGAVPNNAVAFGVYDIPAFPAIQAINQNMPPEEEPLELYINPEGLNTIINAERNFVGIGVVNPSEELDVLHNIELGGALGEGLKFSGYGYNNWILTYWDNPNREDVVRFYAPGNQNSAEILRYRSDGRVGIGVTDPQDILDIVGDIRVRGADIKDTGGTARVTLTDNGRLDLKEDGGSVSLCVETDGDVGVGTIASADITHKLTIKDSSTDDVLRLIGPDGGSLGYGARINFGDANYVYIEEDADDDLYIYAGGRTAIMGGEVGIGDTTPDGKLEVRQTAAADIFNLYDSSTNVFTVEDGGDVGIGITNPSESLDVSGNIEIGGSLGYGIKFSGHTNDDLILTLWDTPYDIVRFYTPGNQRAAEVMRIRSDGRLGLLETDPVTTLDVNGGVATKVVTKTSAYTATNSDFTILVNANSGAVTITLPAASTVDGQILVIKKIDSSGNSVTIDGNGAETIDDTTTKVTTTQYDSWMIQSDGSEWWII